jgi:hypothetical protein
MRPKRLRHAPSIERFWLYVACAQPDECWWWIGGTTHSATNDVEYGSLAWPSGTSRMHGAHRICWEIHRGHIPAGLDICHTCDHPLCVNINHLFMGTPADNTHDMHRKGRHRGGAPHGERNALAKLTTDKVREIRRRYALGGIRQKDLAREFGITQGTLGKVVRRELWAHVE